LEKKAISYVILTLLLIGILSMAFKIQPVKAESGTIYIKADGSIDPPTAPISSMDNITYTFTADIYDSIVFERDNIVLDGAGYTLQGTRVTWSKGITLSNRVNTTVTNTRITNFTIGIYGYLSLYNNIWGNKIANNVYGISLHYSSGNNISTNNITANIGYGIYLANSENNGIMGNNITATEGYSIYIVKSSINSISSNNIANNDCGIVLSSSNNNSISGNNITANNDRGIWLSGSSYNSVYSNNFVNNTSQVYSKASVNIWDSGYPSGGNYWSDYGGVDRYSGSYQNETGSDAIGDTPYVIDDNNQDNYPLMEPSRTFNVTKNGETYEITTLSNSTIASFQYNSSLNEISFNVTGPDGTTGFCKIIVPKELGDTFEVLVDGVPTTYTQTENSTHYFLYFTYQHSTHIISITIIPSPSKLVEKLIEEIETLNLPKGTICSLAKKLEEAHRLLEKGNENGAMHKLMDFINQVEALRGKKLTNEQADYLTSEAQRIIDLIKE